MTSPAPGRLLLAAQVAAHYLGGDVRAGFLGEGDELNGGAVLLPWLERIFGAVMGKGFHLQTFATWRQGPGMERTLKTPIFGNEPRGSGFIARCTFT